MCRYIRLICSRLRRHGTQSKGKQYRRESNRVEHFTLIACQERRQHEQRSNQADIHTEPSNRTKTLDPIAKPSTSRTPSKNTPSNMFSDATTNTSYPHLVESTMPTTPHLPQPPCTLLWSNRRTEKMHAVTFCC